MHLNPALHRFPDEAAIIGRMVLAYGELELLVGLCLAAVLGDRDTALRTMFRILGETNRIGAADAIMYPKYASQGLEGEYGQGMGAVRWCTTTRNQYAHCQWVDHHDAGLFYTNLQDPAKKSTTFEYWYRHVDVPILEEQEAYFGYAADWLLYLEAEYSTKKGLIVPGFPKPKALAQPNLHNPPAQHIPPWLAEVEKQRHLERALESEKRARSQKQKPEAQQRPEAQSGKPAKREDSTPQA